MADGRDIARSFIAGILFYNEPQLLSSITEIEGYLHIFPKLWFKLKFNFLRYQQ